MFPTRFFPDRMFAPRYWPKVGASGAGGGDATRFGIQDRGTSFAIGNRLTQWPLADRGTEYEIKPTR